MIQVTGVAIRSNKRVILPKANWANVPTIFLWWNIISKTFAAWTLILFQIDAPPQAPTCQFVYGSVSFPSYTNAFISVFSSTSAWIPTVYSLSVTF